MEGKREEGREVMKKEGGWRKWGEGEKVRGRRGRGGNINELFRWNKIWEFKNRYKLMINVFKVVLIVELCVKIINIVS